MTPLVRHVTGTLKARNQAIEELRLTYVRSDLTDEEFETRRETLERSE